MGSQRPPHQRQIDQDGVVRVEQRRKGSGKWILWSGLAVTVLCLGLSAWLVSSPEPVPMVEYEPPVRAEPSAMPAPPLPRAPVRQVARPVAQAAPGQEPIMTQDDYDSRPKEGIGLYRPGTNPLLQGIVVPEDCELPPGYVRHYQTTDDGQSQRPILMFHPDYTPVDANGQPVEIPASRVVPIELAPPGMPIDILEPPPGPEGVEPMP
jgi:hypothetical protein